MTIGDIKKAKHTREYKQHVDWQKPNYPIPSDDEDIYEGSGSYGTSTTKPRYGNSISITLGPVEQRLGARPTDDEKSVRSKTVTLHKPISTLIILLAGFRLAIAQALYWRDD
jgi:hypothetical protein